MTFSICFGRSKNPLLIPRQFGKLPLIRSTTVANPEYHQLYFMPILPGYRLDLVRYRLDLAGKIWLG